MTVILYREDPKKSTKKLLKLVNELCETVIYKVI